MFETQATCDLFIYKSKYKISEYSRISAAPRSTLYFYPDYIIFEPLPFAHLFVVLYLITPIGLLGTIHSIFELQPSALQVCMVRIEVDHYWTHTVSTCAPRCKRAVVSACVPLLSITESHYRVALTCRLTLSRNQVRNQGLASCCITIHKAVQHLQCLSSRGFRVCSHGGPVRIYVL